MWPGPYGDWGSRKYLLASLDQSLKRMGLDYVDIFYSHRADPETPLEETMGALDTAVRQGKALYVGISSYSPRRTEEAIEILRHLGTPVLIHQPSYSMFNRWIEPELLGVLDREGVGCIAFSPLAQGLLTNKYLDGVPDDSRVRRGLHFSVGPDHAGERRARAGAQRDRRAARTDRWPSWPSPGSCATRGSPRRWWAPPAWPSSRTRVASLDTADFDDAELAEIDEYAVDGALNIWAAVLRRVSSSRGAADGRWWWGPPRRGYVARPNGRLSKGSGRPVRCRPREAVGETHLACV